LHVGPFQPDLEDSFCEAVATLRERDRLASIHVLVPTHILGRHLMRTVARRYGICFNVRFHTFPDLAEIIGIEELVATGRIPLPPLADFLIARKAINAAVPPDGYFAPIRHFPSTPRTLLASLTDLKKAGITPDRLEEFARAQGSPKLAEVAAIYREAERLRVEAGYFDESERLAIAAQAAPSSRLLDAALAVCLYGFAELNRLEERFLAACLANRTGFAFVPEDVAGRTRPMIEWLTAEGFTAGPRGGKFLSEGPHALAAAIFQETIPSQPVACDAKIVSAPGIQIEVEEIARHILAHVSGPEGSFSDVGVLLRHPAAYERTIRDVFESVGIPLVFLDGLPYADTRVGRLLRLLLRIRLGDYPRPDVMEFLSLAPLRPSLVEDFPEASPADWDRFSREAGIVQGREHWARIPEVRRRIEWRMGRLRKETAEDPDEAGLRLLERDVLSLRVFERVINTLLKRLVDILDSGTVGELMGKLLRALLTVAHFQEEERAVVKALAAIARDHVADEDISVETLGSLAEDFLAERLPPTEVYRTGKVVVASLSGAAGLPFRLVLIPGLVERSFPPPLRQDPVVLDREREALNAAYATSIPVRERQATDERFVFRHALSASVEAVVLSFPRLDAATGQVRVPSHFLLRVAEAVVGGPVDYARLERADLTHRIPVGRPEPDQTTLTVGEWDLSVVVQALRSGDGAPVAGLPGVGALRRGLAAEGGRWGRRRFTEFDGMLGVSVPLPETMAATQLETYGLCPFKFFGERVLGVREVDEPEAVETITPLDRGAIIHDILERFLAGLAADGLLPLDRARLNEYRSRLKTIAQEAFRSFERSGAVGYPFMWRVEQERILTDLEGFLTQELDDATGFVPTFFEARFGPTPPWAKPPRGSTPYPLELDLNGRTLRFTGFIDRIDVHPSGAARVIDYKSGGIYGVKDNRFQGGKHLQLPIYIHAADAILKSHGIPATTTDGQYYYVTGKGGFKRILFTREALEARVEEFNTILRTMADGIAGGIFPQHPGEKGENCEWCPFQPVCGHGRVRLIERKREDPAAARLAQMWEIE
jgi:ATP-dependent helicase/DNAse subunit B